ncbi:XTP/dITP diphosphohydrolase [Candidatus Kryptobacter tengchongensis]|uniref:Nucleoside triphosphate pyrophosphohydrolase n=2 Tax=Kryptobacter tengchongensis TaxID=1643429 RepID=A0A916LKD0_KRYT1|nr:nucleoside triphosphate pyrophosphohydrolase [Candidatus Kryptobacter tengchongensis]CUT04144.1 XTP/dITP diphosphohydrolase [Candidatus Kryptobacter tengchongensis]CUU03891.1 XTP/dITP diphosphohydrolase [Candidatus Kryptobacter tengchongensis]CUU04687.1 XTP/dITP diphosphohydrolase [Candidatus Kryptobacter tengchongensis]
MNKTNELFLEFVEIVRKLRKECPWDREQTHKSIRHNLIEEAYETVEAIDKDDFEELKKELGDLLLHVVMHSVMAEEENKFTIDEVISGIKDKLIYRHPHVFGNVKVNGSKEVKHNWEKLKRSESNRDSVISGIPKSLPALIKAYRVQEKAGSVGFDWTNIDDVWKKVEEEISELKKTLEIGEQSKIEEELGDLLFAIVNYSRFLRINPESALNKAVEKFTHRFQLIEKELKAQGKDIYSSTLEEMDAIWEKIKKEK